MSGAKPNLHAVQAYNPYALPTPILQLNDLANNFSAAMINNMRSALYISNFIKRIMRSRVPCESMMRMKEMACSKNTLVNNFIPLDTLVNVAERLSSNKSMNEDIPFNIDWGNDLTSAILPPGVKAGGGKLHNSQKTKKQIKHIKQYAKNLKKIFKMYVEILEPIHQIVQTGGHFYTDTVEILEELLKDFNYKKASNFMMYRPTVNGKKLNRGLWHSVSDLHSGILKSNKSRLTALSNIIRNGKCPEKRGMTIGLVEWRDWKKISEEGITSEQAKSEYTDIVKKGLDELYNGYKSKNDTLIKETEKIEKNYEKLKEKCNNYNQYEDKSDPWDDSKHKEQCESNRGCKWQLNKDRKMICHPGPNPSLLRSLMPEAIAPSCAVSEGPCNLMKAITHYICPYNKFNIELVEKIDNVFSQEKIIRFLTLFHKFAKAFLGNNSLIAIAIMQVIRDMKIILLENKDNEQYLELLEFESQQHNEPEQNYQFSLGGGKSVYNYIVNPKTNRKVKIDSKLGNEIIKEYIKYQNK